MIHDAQTLKHIIDYCEQKWLEADRPTASNWPTPDMLTGHKMAYNTVIQYARRLISEEP